MTPAVLVHKIWHTRIGVSALLSFMILIIGLLVYVIFANTQVNTVEIVKYGSSRYVPDKEFYCPGDTMIYNVRVEVDNTHLPTTIEIDEAWKTNSGISLKDTAVYERIPQTVPFFYDGPAKRIVPDLKPGIYWLDHVSTNGSNNGYRVGPINVVECNNESSK